MTFPQGILSTGGRAFGGIDAGGVLRTQRYGNNVNVGIATETWSAKEAGQQQWQQFHQHCEDRAYTSSAGISSPSNLAVVLGLALAIDRWATVLGRL